MQAAGSSRLARPERKIIIAPECGRDQLSLGILCCQTVEECHRLAEVGERDMKRVSVATAVDFDSGGSKFVKVLVAGIMSGFCHIPLAVLIIVNALVGCKNIEIIGNLAACIVS